MESQNVKYRVLNPERKPLTPEKLRELSGLDVTDEQAISIIESLAVFAKLLYMVIGKEDRGIFDERVIKLHDNSEDNQRNIA